MKILAVLFTTIILNASLSLASPETPTPTPTPAPEMRAIEVSFFGGIAGFDDVAYKAVKSLMGTLLAEGTIDQYKTTFWGREGGSSFCIELSSKPKSTLTQIAQMLGAIHPRDNSVYEFSSVVKCQ